mgnify:CR=1 FL=1
MSIVDCRLSIYFPSYLHPNPNPNPNPLDQNFSQEQKNPTPFTSNTNSSSSSSHNSSPSLVSVNDAMTMSSANVTKMNALYPLYGTLGRTLSVPSSPQSQISISLSTSIQPPKLVPMPFSPIKYNPNSVNSLPPSPEKQKKSIPLGRNNTLTGLTNSARSPTPTTISINGLLGAAETLSQDVVDGDGDVDGEDNGDGESHADQDENDNNGDDDAIDHFPNSNSNNGNYHNMYTNNLYYDNEKVPSCSSESDIDDRPESMKQSHQDLMNRDSSSPARPTRITSSSSSSSFSSSSPSAMNTNRLPRAASNNNRRKPPNSPTTPSKSNSKSKSSPRGTGTPSTTPKKLSLNGSTSKSYENIQSSLSAAMQGTAVDECLQDERAKKQLLLYMALGRDNPRVAQDNPPPGTIHDGFFWGSYPHLEMILRDHMEVSLASGNGNGNE